jgi:Zn-dependent protease with chaperone function
MRISLPPTAPDKIKRLEAAAAARPGLYRARLVLLALVGDALLTFVRAVPLAGPVAFGTLLFLPDPLFLALGSGAVVLLIWVTRPGVRETGRSISRTESPELYAALDDLKTRLDVGRRLDVRLEHDVNAGAREARGLFGLLGTRRVLTLGVPLLALLGKDEARAVIAHEFGHLSRRHGRHGHWLYWAHLDWLWHAEQTDEDSSIIYRAGGAIAEMFAPIFSRRAMVWSRRSEYEADADAAGAVGGAYVVSALARLDAFSAWQADELPRITRGWQRAEPTAPQDWLERMIAAFEALSADTLATAAAEAASRTSDWADTHPKLPERAAALGLKPCLAPRNGPAGSALLGAYWPTAAADFNARWRKESAVAWAVAHARYRLIEAPLIAAAPETAAEWPIAQRLARATALRRSEPTRGLAELAALHAAAPDNRHVTFAHGAARLADGDASAVESLLALAKADASWRVPVCTRLVWHHNRIDDRAGTGRWADQLHHVSESAARSYAQICDNLAAGQLAATARPAPLIEALRAGFAADPTVAKAWLVQGKAETGRVSDALILVLDPFDETRQPYDTGVVEDRHYQQLADLIEPNGLPVVISFYSTEPLPVDLQAALDKLPAASAYAR